MQNESVDNVDPPSFTELQGQTVVLTGATGSFGRHICRALVKASGVKRLLLFSRDEERQRLLRLELDAVDGDIGNVEFVLGDVRDRDALMRVAAGTDLIINSAALKQVPACELNALEAVHTNVLGMQNILDAAAERGVRQVLAISTDKAVQPINAMGISKAMQERIIQSHALRWESPIAKVVRYGNVLGSTGSILPVFASQLKKKGRITVTAPHMTRFLLVLDDAMALVHRALLGEDHNGTIYVRKSPATTVQDIARSALRVFSDGDEGRIDVVGVRPGDKIHEVLVSEDEMRRAREEEGYFVIPPVPLDVSSPTGDVPVEPVAFSSDAAARVPDEQLDSLVRDWAESSSAYP